MSWYPPKPYYFGSDCIDDDGSFIGYDPGEDMAGGDAFLEACDAEIGAVDHEEMADEQLESIGGMHIGDAMKRRARRMARLEKREEKIKRRMRRAGPKRAKRLAKRAGRIQNRVERLALKQQQKAEKAGVASSAAARALRSAAPTRKASGAAAALAKAAAKSPRASLSPVQRRLQANTRASGRGAQAPAVLRDRPARPRGAARSRIVSSPTAVPAAVPSKPSPSARSSAMESVILSLPREGDLVRIPFLFNGNTYNTLSVTATAAGSTTTVTGTTAAITYAKLRLLAVLVEVAVVGTAAQLNAHLRLNSINVAGGIPCLYGIQTGVVELYTSTTGSAKLLVPSLRDNPIIHVNQTVSCQASLVSFGGAALTAFGSVQAICERISDPEAQASP